MPDVAVSVSVRRPRLSLKAPLSKPAVPRQEVVPAYERDATPHPPAFPAASDDRDGRVHDLLGEIANAADILQAASDGIASLQKWTRVGCAIAELMREASLALEAGKEAASLPARQALLGSLVTQYNTVLEQVDGIARDARRGGVNLLMGDTLTLAGDETAASRLVIGGSVCDAAGLGLAPLAAGTDLAQAAETVLAALRAANATLRTRAQSITAHLALVRSRQQFFGNLQGLCDGGAPPARAESASEEAANSLALSTRQAIATSALALAQDSQTSILRLLNRSNFFGRES
jgi:hypothetical protein